MKIKRNLKMGNVLCKNKKNQTQNTGKGPIDGIIGRCTQICPHSIGKKKHFWDKQVLETCPPCRQQPKPNDSGWSTVSLTVPDGIDYHPIPPPRKKRLIKQSHVESIDSNLNKSLDYHDDEKKSIQNETKMEEVKNTATIFEKTLSNKTDGNDLKETVVGEKENDIKTINDSNEKEKTVEDENVKISDEKTKVSDEKTKILDENIKISDVLPHTEEEINITVIRNISKIGNKKSDKFFGENLSQSLSDEPILNSESVQSKDLPDKTLTIENDESKEMKKENNDDANSILDKTKDENDHHSNKIESIEDSEEMIHKINKEKGNLMFALENQLPEKGDIDPDAIPVEEEIIVPVKRETRHICDDDLSIHDILHKPYLPPLPDTIPPKKPQRDFSRYKKSLETVKSDQPNNDPSQGDDDNTISLENQIIKAPYASEEELHSEAETLPLEDSPEKKSPPPRSIKLKAQRSSEISEPNLTKSEKILRRCLSSQSYVTSDLIKEITQQANNFSMPTIDFVPEDYTITSSNDGTSNFSPNLILTEKKHKISQNSIDTEIDSKVIINGHNSAEAEAEKVNLNTILNNREEYLPNYEEATGIPRNYSSITPDTTIERSETISSSTSTQEEPAKKQLPIDPGFHRKVSSTKEISDAIKSFLAKDDLNSKEILKLLEEEFGDLLNSSCLSDEDREVIKKLRDSVEIETDDNDNKLIAKETEKQAEEISKTENKSTNSSNTETEAVVITTEKPNLITIKLDNQFDLKSPRIINKALEAVKSGEKRRHSIDDLDSWFSPADSSSIKDSADNNNDEDDQIKYRKREISLPNVFEDNNTVITTANNKITNGSGVCSLVKNDHSSLLKFLEREKANHI